MTDIVYQSGEEDIESTASDSDCPDSDNEDDPASELLRGFGLTLADWMDMVEEAGDREKDEDREEDAARRLKEEQELHDG